MSDGSSDVTKALAAFGAPAIRYHSFGQAAVRPSSVVLPRQTPPLETAAPAHLEPVAAPEPVAAVRIAPVAAPLMQKQPPHAAPAPVLVAASVAAAPPTAFAAAASAGLAREPTFRRSAFLPMTPTATPSPLAEWAAPAAALQANASRSLPPLLRPEPAPPRAAPARAAAPVATPAPALARPQSPRPPPPPSAEPVYGHAAPVVPTPMSRVRRAPGAPVAALTLPEIFRFLAAVPDTPGDGDGQAD